MEAFTAQYTRQQDIAAIIVRLMHRRIIRGGAEFDQAWRDMRADVLAILQLGRAAAIHAAIAYTGDALAETGQSGAPYGALVPGRFLDTEPNGMPVGTTLDTLPIKAKTAVADGSTSPWAVASQWSSGVALTILADTRRDVYQADMVQRPRVTGYVRMLNPPSCPRCVILAGKRFRWNQGFQRHPRCDCFHIPASENVAGDLRTDPYEYFDSLSNEAQDRWFGKVQAQAIRDGADIYRVVNFGPKGLGTAGGNARFGTPFKRTLEDIYAHDPDRRFVVENLQYHGWITGPQTAGGNILGNPDFDAVALAAGRGRGTYLVGGQTVTTARAARYDAALSGTRDPLHRATMTAAERRLYDAHYRATWARAGYHPNTVGPNSADRGLGLRPITADEARRAEETLARELAQLGLEGTPRSVHELAAILGY